MVRDLHLTVEEVSTLQDKLPSQCHNVALFERGKRGVLFTACYAQKDVVVKVPRNSSKATSTALLEAQYLKKVNELGIGPRLYDFSDEYVMMEFVSGRLIGEFLADESVSSDKVVFVLLAVFDQLIALDKAGINKFELTNPYKHIIIKDNLEPVLIDFERARHSLRPKNVTQFSEYLTRKNVLPFLQKHDLLLDVVLFKAGVARYLQTGVLPLEEII